MFSKENNILELNPYQKSDKAPFLIYVDLACIIKKIHRCKNNPENSSTTNVSEHIPSGFQCLQYLHLQYLHLQFLHLEVKIV